MSISKSSENKNILKNICNKIFKEENVRCYFCEIIGKRWSFIAGDEDILSAPQRYVITENLGILADKEIKNLNKYKKLLP